MTRGVGRKTGGVQNDGKGDNVAGPWGRMVRPSMASAFVVVRPSVASTPVVVRPSMASTPVHRRTDGQTDRRTVRELLNPPLLSFFAIADNLVWNDKRRGVRFFIHHSSFLCHVERSETSVHRHGFSAAQLDRLFRNCLKIIQ